MFEFFQQVQWNKATTLSNYYLKEILSGIGIKSEYFQENL